MICPRCANPSTRVPYTDKSGAVVRRLRMCPKCGFSFNTTERPSFTLFTEEEIKEYEEYIAKELVESQKDPRG